MAADTDAKVKEKSKNVRNLWTEMLIRIFHEKNPKIFAEKPQFKKVIYCNYFLPFITHLPF